jgi:hypothetical protein
MLAAAGGVAGLQIAVWATDVLRAYFPNLDLSLDPRIALIGFGVALFTGVATGIAPALQSTRPDMALAMKEGSSGAGRPRSIVREGLIVVQVALSVLLLGAGGLLVRSFFMLHRGPGFDPDRVAIVRLRPSLVGFTIDRAWAYQRKVIERLEALPGVLAASPASDLAAGPARDATESDHRPAGRVTNGVRRLSTQTCVDFLHNDSEAAVSGRPPARHARSPDPPNAPARAESWSRHREAHSTNLRRPAAGRNRLTVPSALSARGQRLDRRVLGAVR